MATERVKPITPLLEAEYSAEAGKLVLPAIDEMLMMLPDFCLIIISATAWFERKTPVRLMSMSRCHCFNDTWGSGAPV